MPFVVMLMSGVAILTGSEAIERRSPLLGLASGLLFFSVTQVWPQ